MRFIYLFFVVILFCCSNPDNELKITEYVDPFIGTSGEGHCFPGAVIPFGGIQFSPDNPCSDSGRSSGYHYSDSIIASFSLTHLSGCPQGDLQDIRFLPVLIKPDTSCDAASYIHSGYALFSHHDEQAEPGYYSVKFKNGITTELSVTDRCGFQYYQYPEEGVKALTIDLGTACNWDQTTETAVRKVNERTLEGYRKSQGLGKDQRVYFIIEFSQDCKVMAGDEKFRPLENGQRFTGKNCYIWIDFGKSTNKILAKVSISSANTEGAAANLEKELSHWSFDKVKRDAKMKWKRILSKIKAESKDEELLRVFYTAMYHAYTAPYLFSDVNRNYKGPDDEIHSVNKSQQYTVFALPNTYRAVHPLLTITQKKLVPDLINSMLKHYDIYGVLPEWEFAGNETKDTNSYHAIPVITEAWIKGIHGFESEKAYEAMKKTIQVNALHGSTSKDLCTGSEYAYANWCMAQFAKALQKEEDYLSFLNESHKSGSLYPPACFPPHDIEQQIQLYGGRELFAAQLDRFFCDSVGSVSANKERIGQYTHGNVCLHHIPYLYNYVGQPQKTQYYVNKIMAQCYANAPDGLCSAEACGQLSAWYVFSAMGFYPVNPAEGKYQLGIPLFEKVTIRTGPEKKFIITANSPGAGNTCVKGILLNGKKLQRTWITHSEIMEGGTLEFVFSAQ